MNVLRKRSFALINHVSHHLHRNEKYFGQSLVAIHYSRKIHNLSILNRSGKNHQIIKQISLFPSQSYHTKSNNNNNMTNKRNDSFTSNCNNHVNTNHITFARRHQSQSKTFLDGKQYGLCFLGAPGVGKGTYSGRLATQLNAKVLSSGDLIRDCAKLNEGTAMGKKLSNCINSGQLVPDDIVIPMVVDYLRLLPETFILDGFPRTYAQAKRIHGEYRLHAVLHFKLPDHILIGKILGRRICNNCGANFNIADIDEGEICMPSMAPKEDGVCDNCNHELTTRPDDTESTIRERLRIYHEQTGPIEQFYKEAGLLLTYNIKKGIDDLPDILNKLEYFITHNYYSDSKMNKEGYISYESGIGKKRLGNGAMRAHAHAQPSF